jgi:hypothetical protein
MAVYRDHELDELLVQDMIVCNAEWDPIRENHRG